MFIPSITDASASTVADASQSQTSTAPLNSPPPTYQQETRSPYAIRQPQRRTVHYPAAIQAELRRTQRLEPAYFYR